MLLEQKVEIQLNSANYKWYKEKGYEFDSIKEIIIVDIHDLSKGSGVYVWVQCDYCGEKILRKYNDYIRRCVNHITPKIACNKKECKQQKKIETCRANFGVDHPGQSEEITEKMKQSRKENLGYEWAMQNKEVKRKTKQSLHKNGTAACSKQQKYLCNLLGGILNFPIDNCSVDILLKNNIIIEYNGGGHDKNVHAGVITREEFDEKERKRDYFIKSKGYKIIKIISPRDYLPPDDKIIELINNAVEFLDVNNANHYNIEFNDKINDKNYGKLRRITEKDLELQESNMGSFLIA